MVRGAHHGHCHLGIATADRGRMMGSLQCGTARAASTTVPTTPPTLSQLWLPMQPAIRAANQLVCRVWESLKESGTIFTRCALKLTAAALLMLSMVLSSPSISRAARSDAKEAIISQQSVKQKKQNRVDDNKKTQSRVIDNKKTQIKVDDNKKTQIKVDNNSKKTQNKVVDSKKTQNKAVDNKKTESRVVDNKKTPSSKALSLAGDSESVVRSKQLTNFGLLLVGCSALYVVATGSNSGSARRGARKGAADLSSDYDDGYGSSRGAAVVPPRRSPLGRRGVLSRAPQRFEDLLGDQDEADPLFDDILPPVSDSSTTAAAKGSKVETTSSDAASQQVPAISIPMGRQKMTSKLVGSQSDDPSVDSSKLTSSTVTSALLPPYAAIIAAPEESKLLLESASSPPAPSMTTPPNAATTTAAASSKRQQQQPGILGRLFQKPGAGRPSDLRAALRPEQDESHDYRVLVASSLSVYVPPGTIVEVEKGGSLSSADPDAFSSSSEVRQSALAAEMAYAGLSEQEAAECFADVASAMIVQLVDKAVQLSDKDKDKGGGQQQWEAAVVRSLDGLTDLIKGAGELFRYVLRMPSPLISQATLTHPSYPLSHSLTYSFTHSHLLILPTHSLTHSLTYPSYSAKQLQAPRSSPYSTTVKRTKGSWRTFIITTPDPRWT